MDKKNTLMSTFSIIQILLLSKKYWKNIAVFSNLETINDFTQYRQEKLSFTTAQLCSLRYLWSSISLKSQSGGNK